MPIERTEFKEFSQANAFIGNTLLKPMSQTSDAGLSPEFWEAFPNFGSMELRNALNGCANWAYQHQDIPVDKLVREVSTEFAKLFIGPPEPSAAPWETMHQANKTSTGFGKPTFHMKELLRNAGVQLSNANNQYEDHIGIEFLYISVCYRKAADGDEVLLDGLQDFVRMHPLAWIGDLLSDVDSSAPDGYYAHVLRVAEALLNIC